MPNNLKPGDKFPNFQLPNHKGKVVSPAKFTAAPLVDKMMGFNDGYPLIIIFNRGYFCPRDQQQLRMLRTFQDELMVNYCKLITISTDQPNVIAALKAGLDAHWTFVSDHERTLINQLDIVDKTEGEYAFRALPYTYVLKPDLTIYKIYDGWFFVGRPTLEELRQDLREIMKTLSNYKYDDYNTEEAKRVRIPQQVWQDSSNRKKELNNKKGLVKWFDKKSGNGMITEKEKGIDVFFNFTAIPGEGYRTINPGQYVSFELREATYGPVAFRVIPEE